VVFPKGTAIAEDTAIEIANLNLGSSAVLIKARVTDQIEYLSADDEDTYIIAQANAQLDDKWQFVGERISCVITRLFC
jgi:DNA-directed RNA polymerase beta subunit